MAIGGPPASSRGKDTSRGAAGRYAFVIEVARGYPGTLWIAYDPADASPQGTTFVRHIAPIAMTNVRAALLEAVRWGQGAKLPQSALTLEVVEGRTSLDVVMPAPPGEVLRTLLRTIALKHVPTEPGLLLGVAKSLLDELYALHQHGAATSSKHGFGGVHPDSIYIDTEGRVRLLDIGSSAATSAREPWHSDPQRMGYFAPEQLDTRGVPDARTDVFAVGVILWEALTNRRLFPGNDAKTVRERVQKGPIARLDATRSSAAPGIATPISDVVARALERDPSQRFQSADEMANAIAALECADSRRIGEWVASTADAAISKRRQVVERARAGASLAGDSLAPAPPGGLRPSHAPAAPRAPSVPPAARTSVPPAARTSVAPRPAASTPPPPASMQSPAPSPKPPAASPRPLAPSPKPPAATPSAPPPPKSAPPVAPSPPAPRSTSVAPSPPAAGKSPSTVTASASAAPAAATATPAARPSVGPPRPGTPSVPPAAPPAEKREEPAAEPPRSEMDSVDRESLDASEDLADEVEDDYSEVSHEIPQPDAPAEGEKPAAEAATTAAEAATTAAEAATTAAEATTTAAEATTTAAEATATGDAKMETVPAQEAPHETAEPPRSTKRPPELPASVHPPGDVLEGSNQSLSSAISISPMRALTEPAKDRGRPFRVGAVVLLLFVGIGIGGIFVARKRAANEAAMRAAGMVPLKPAQSISAPPIVISAPVPESPPSASGAAADTAPPAPEAPAPSESPPTKEPTAAAGESAHETPSVDTSHTGEEKGSASQSGTESGKHRSSGSRNVPNAGYKPGGI